MVEMSKKKWVKMRENGKKNMHKKLKNPYYLAYYGTTNLHKRAETWF